MQQVVERALAARFGFWGDGAAEFRKTLALGRDWKPKDLGVAAFVQDAAGRDVLQATALANCVKG